MSTPIVPLGQLCDMDRQGIHPDDAGVSELPFVGVENVESESGHINLSNESRVGNQKSTAFRFDERHVLYAKLRPYLNKVAIPGFAGRCSTELVPLLPREGVDREFVAYLLRRKETVEYAMASVTGARMPRTDMKALFSLLVPLPPLDEQRRLVDILNRAGRIGRLRAQAEERLREFIPALFVRMFGDPAAKSSRPNQETIRLGDIAVIIPGQSPPGKTYNDSGEGLPFFQGKADFGNFHPIARKWCVAPKKIAEPGDVLISVRAPVGPTNLADQRCCIGRGLTAIRPDESVALRDFVYWSLKHLEPDIAGIATGTTFAAITRRDLESVMVSLPPLARQREFSEIVEKARATFALSEAGGAAAATLSASLMSRLLGDAA